MEEPPPADDSSTLWQRPRSVAFTPDARIRQCERPVLGKSNNVPVPLLAQSSRASAPRRNQEQQPHGTPDAGRLSQRNVEPSPPVSLSLLSSPSSSPLQPSLDDDLASSHDSITTSPSPPLPQSPQRLAMSQGNYASLATLVQVLELEPSPPPSPRKAVSPQLSLLSAMPPKPAQAWSKADSPQGDAQRMEGSRAAAWRRSQSVPWDTRQGGDAVADDYEDPTGGRSNLITTTTNVTNTTITINEASITETRASGAVDENTGTGSIIDGGGGGRVLTRSKSWEGRRSKLPEITVDATADTMEAAAREGVADYQELSLRPRAKLVLAESRMSLAPAAHEPSDEEAEEEEKQRAHRPTLSDMGHRGNGLLPDSHKVLMVEMQREMKSRWTIPYSELQLLGKIGMGDFGIVYLAKWRNSKVVVKQLFHKSKLTGSELNDFRKEMDIIMNLRPHHNLIQFFGMCDEPPDLCIVTEEALSPATKLQLALDTAAGMTHLHAENILHCDLARRNILVTTSNGEYQAKVTDFGLSKRVTSGRVRHSFSHSQACGPIKWMSPEALRQNRLSKQSDVYSFGVVMWEILLEKAPYEQMDAVEAGQAIVEGKKLEIPAWAPAEYASLLSDCWHDDPALRPSFNDIYLRIERWDGSGRG
ncbi:protein kinase domain containing protein [Acanthamoeba castellanii str. Neff]|uniref:Protein kinase domain containing protein n=1 Tax=Acanthamoeba castellanii (strain ATCC 30010 / Neff) TaxID=1257118 RepID=L8GT85_ACACF|nr:protein kinase domain containing protein [Acanthamoeba castellanii str. Neff]ELR16409.1 protein kinase domain containing protein [Acanthamoeba castellanii str. Neff]